VVFAWNSRVELEGRWLVILGECTRQKPSDKLTPLLTRTNELLAVLGAELEILPVVFVSSSVSASDVTQAAEDGIGIAGADEIRAMWEGLSQRWGARETVQFLKQLSERKRDSLHLIL
jgi:hypothetical protein